MISAGVHDPSTPVLPRVLGDHHGATDGPTLVVVGGLHANEPAGIEAAQRIHRRFAEDPAVLRAGRLISLRGNVTALSRSVSHRGDDDHADRPRYIDEDLNRVFTDTVCPNNSTTVEQRERVALADALDRIARDATHPVYLVDLHTVSSQSPPFVVLEDSLAARRFASAFPLPMVLGLEEELRGLLIDDATRRLGFVSCIIESGRHDDPRSADVHEALVLLALASLGMLDRDPAISSGEPARIVAAHAAGPRAGQVYDLRQRVEIGHDSFEMMPKATAFSRVHARRTVLATERSRPITADADGLLFMPNRQERRRVGDDGFFVIAKISPGWLRVSTVLRRREYVHRLLPALLPGVRRRPGDPHAILIAPEYAAVFRREILHLLGYRLVRWHHAPYLSRRRRLVRGLLGIGRSLLGIASRALAGGERAALPDERDIDWIARRRRLDIKPPGVSCMR